MIFKTINYESEEEYANSTKDTPAKILYYVPIINPVKLTPIRHELAETVKLNSYIICSEHNMFDYYMLNEEHYNKILSVSASPFGRVMDKRSSNETKGDMKDLKHLRKNHLILENYNKIKAILDIKAEKLYKKNKEVFYKKTNINEIISNLFNCNKPIIEYYALSKDVFLTTRTNHDIIEIYGFMQHGFTRRGMFMLQYCYKNVNGLPVFPKWVVNERNIKDEYSIKENLETLDMQRAAIRLSRIFMRSTLNEIKDLIKDYQRHNETTAFNSLI